MYIFKKSSDQDQRSVFGGGGSKWTLPLCVFVHVWFMH